MLHVSATAADALCRCGYEDHPRGKAYANSMLQLAAMFGYFCACWGPLRQRFSTGLLAFSLGETRGTRSTMVEWLDVTSSADQMGHVG